MLLAYYVFTENSLPELCLIPELLDNRTIPVRIDFLTPSDAAVYFVGSKEAVAVEPQREEHTTILRALPPAVLYLTPNSSLQPGIAAQRLKIFSMGERRYQVFFTRENSENWRPWVANRATQGVDF